MEMESKLTAPGRRSSSDSKPGYIIYQSMDKRLTLLDIPGSLREHCHVDPVVIEAPQEPFPNNEPKTVEKRQSILQRQGISKEGEFYHQQLETELEAALLEMHQHIGRAPWCHDRLPHVLQQNENETALKEASQRNQDRETRVVENPSNQPASIKYNSRNYIIPPHSAFLCATISAGASAFISPNSTPFSLILLDPPWHNRSARNTGYYQTEDSTAAGSQLLSETVQILLPYLAPRATVAVWITNSVLVRRHTIYILSSTLHYSLDEEWIWLKTTTSGQPITPLHGVWRKPYEALLLFRHLPQKRRKDELYPDIRRRILVAVPNLHSQKPCLRGMFGQEEKVLEVFARNVVESWWAWGSQVLMGNEVTEGQEGRETVMAVTGE